MPARHLLLPLALTLTAVAGAQPADEPDADAPLARRLAVIVGVNVSREGLRKLDYAVDDARAVYRWLTQPGLGLFASDDAALLTDVASRDDWLPTATNVLARLSEAAQAAGPDDLLLFYFSGHGTGQHLVTRKDPDHPDVLGVPIWRVNEILAGSKAGLKVVIYDCCRSGEASDDVPTDRMTDEQSAALLQGSRDRITVTSCSAGELSSETSDFGGSVFTHYFCEALADAGDADGDGNVTAQEAWRYARNLTRQWAAKRGAAQLPRIKSDLGSHDDPPLTHPGNLARRPQAPQAPKLTAFELGQAAQERGAYQEAVTAFDEAVTLDPATRPLALCYRGDCNRELGRADQARDDYAQAVTVAPAGHLAIAMAFAGLRALAQEPPQLRQLIATCTRLIDGGHRSAAAFTQRADAHAALREFREAVGDYGRALELPEVAPTVRLARADCAFALGDYAAARTDYEEVLKQRPLAALYARRAICSVRLREFDVAFEDAARATAGPEQPALGWLAKGYCLQERQDVAGALEAFGHAIAGDNKLFEARLARADLHRSKGSLDGAVTDYTALMQVAGKTAEVLIRRAGCQEELKRWSDAQTDYTEAVGLDGKSAAAYAGRGRCLAHLAGETNLQAALKDFDTAIALGDATADTRVARADCRLQVRQVDGALEDYAAAYAADKTNLTPLERHAACLRGLSRWQDAIADYTQLLQAEPENASYYWNRALCHADAGDHGRAVQDYLDAIKRLPGEAQLYLQCAECCEKLKDYNRAVDLYARAIARGTRDTGLYLAYGKCLLRVARYEEAIGVFEAALDLDRALVAAYLGRAEALVSKATPAVAAATEDYAQAVTLDDSCAAGHAGLADCLFREGKYAASCERWSKALERGYSAERVHLARASCLLALKREGEAVEALGAALAANRNSLPALRLRAACLLRLKRPAEAVADCGEALKLEPLEAETYAVRGAAHFDLQDYAAAAADSEQALEAKTPLPPPQQVQARLCRALSLEKLDRRAEALAECRRLLEPGQKGVARETTAAALACRGRLQMLSGDFHLALESFSEALKLDRGAVANWLACGDCQLALSDWRRAAEAYGEALRYDAKNARAYYLRAHARLQAGETDKAKSDAAKSRELGYSDDPLRVYAALEP